MMENLKQKLTLLSSGIASGPSLPMPHESTQLLAKCTLQVLNDITVHDMWCAACLLHPGLTSFQFMPVQAGRDAKMLGEALVQRMLSEYQPATQQTPTSNACSIEPIGGTLGTSSFSLGNQMSFTVTSARIDDYSRYKDIVHTLNAEERRLLRNDDSYIIEFWLQKLDLLPVLSRIALRVFLTPASSSPSERDFSQLKAILDPERTALKDDIINALSYVRDEMKPLVFHVLTNKN